jgi:hypothetical protein
MLRSPRQRRSYFVSPADPAARWTGANGGLAFFAYCTNYLIDLKRAVIVDVEATTAVRQPEVRAQQRMIDRTQERFDYGRNGWRPTAPTVRQRTSLGWFMSDGSSRTSRCSTTPSALMAPSRATTLPMITNATAIPALPGGTQAAPKDLPTAAPFRR